MSTLPSVKRAAMLTSPGSGEIVDNTPGPGFQRVNLGSLRSGVGSPIESAGDQHVSGVQDDNDMFTSAVMHGTCSLPCA